MYFTTVSAKSEGCQSVVSLHCTSTHTHIVVKAKCLNFNTTRRCVGLSYADFKNCAQRSSVNVSYNLRSIVNCMQSVICSLHAVCSLQSANVRHLALSISRLLLFIFSFVTSYFPYFKLVTLKTLVILCNTLKKEGRAFRNIGKNISLYCVISLAIIFVYYSTYC